MVSDSLIDCVSFNLPVVIFFHVKYFEQFEALAFLSALRFFGLGHFPCLLGICQSGKQLFL
jgi:hypothetical protein